MLAAGRPVAGHSPARSEPVLHRRSTNLDAASVQPVEPIVPPFKQDLVCSTSLVQLASQARTIELSAKAPYLAIPMTQSVELKNVLFDVAPTIVSSADPRPAVVLVQIDCAACPSSSASSTVVKPEASERQSIESSSLERSENM